MIASAGYEARGVSEGVGEAMTPIPGQVLPEVQTKGMEKNALVSYLTSIFRSPALDADHFIIYGFVLFSLGMFAWWVIGNIRHSRLLKPLGALIGIVIASFLFLEGTNIYADLRSLKRSLMGEIPYSVESQYLQTQPGPGTLDVYLQKCLRDNKTAYRLIVGGGGEAEEYYFDARGKLIGTFHDSDVHVGNDKGPSVSLSDCHTVTEKEWRR